MGGWWIGGWERAVGEGGSGREEAKNVFVAPDHASSEVAVILAYTHLWRIPKLGFLRMLCVRQSRLLFV